PAGWRASPAAGRTPRTSSASSRPRRASVSATWPVSTDVPYLFDTDAISELLRPRPLPRYVEWLRTVPRSYALRYPGPTWTCRVLVEGSLWGGAGNRP